MPTKTNEQEPDLAAEPFRGTEFAWKVHGYTNDYIRFADPKAAFGMATVAAIVACLFSIKAHQYPSLERIHNASYSIGVILYSLAVIVAFALLIASGFVLTTVVFPRLWRVVLESLVRRAMFWAQQKIEGAETKPGGLIFWKDVVSYKKPEDYAKALLKLDEDKAVKEIASHVYVLAGVADAKYHRLQVGFVIGILGTLLAIVVLAGA